MNIETVYNILKMLKCFSELLKNDMSLETLQAVRDIKGADVLENYEKMFEADAIGTKNNLKNYIVNEINSLTSSFMEVSNYDSNELKTFVDNNLTVPELDIKKLDFILQKFDDDEAFSLISHKLSLMEYANKIAYDAKYLSLIKTDSDIKVSLKDVISKYNIILDMIANTLKDKELITFDIDGTMYGYGEDRQESIDIKKYMVLLKNGLKEITNKISTAVSDIKNNVSDVDYRPSLSVSLRENFMTTVDEYCKGIISTETYDYLYKKQLDIMEFYVRTILAYISTVVSYLEHISSNIETLKDTENAVEVSYRLFNKSE